MAPRRIDRVPSRSTEGAENDEILVQQMMSASLTDDEDNELGVRAFFSEERMIPTPNGMDDKLAVGISPAAGRAFKISVLQNESKTSPKQKSMPALVQSPQHVRFHLVDADERDNADPPFLFYLEPQGDRIFLKNKSSTGTPIILRFDGNSHRHIESDPRFDHYELLVGLYQISLGGPKFWMRILPTAHALHWGPLRLPGSSQEHGIVPIDGKGKRRANDMAEEPSKHQVVQRQRQNSVKDVGAARSTRLQVTQLRDEHCLKVPRSGNEPPYTIEKIKDLRDTRNSNKVFLAKVKRFDSDDEPQPSVLKVRSFTNHTKDLDAFWQEGHTHQEVSEHPSIVTLFHVDARLMSMELEWYRDGDLGNPALRHPNSLYSNMSEEATLRIARAMLGALEFIHSRDIAHNDVKASNILYDKGRDRAVLCDFGLAGPVNERCDGGTPCHFSPEQYLVDDEHNGPDDDENDEPGVGIPRDVWQLGVVLLYLLQLLSLPELVGNIAPSQALDTSLVSRQIQTTEFDLEQWSAVIDQACEDLCSKDNPCWINVMGMLNENPSRRAGTRHMLSVLPTDAGEAAHALPNGTFGNNTPAHGATTTSPPSSSIYTMLEEANAGMQTPDPMNPLSMQFSIPAENLVEDAQPSSSRDEAGPFAASSDFESTFTTISSFASQSTAGLQDMIAEGFPPSVASCDYKRQDVLAYVGVPKAHLDSIDE